MLSSTGPDPVRKRPRHLMDPADPRPPASHRTPMSLTHVQQWVLSTLAVTTLLHFSAGLVAGAFYVGDERAFGQEGLLLLAGVVGIMSVAAGRAIHRKPIASWWLILGVVPAVVGAYALFWS